MKRKNLIVILFVVVASLLFVSNCKDDNTDKDDIEARIETLEDAINENYHVKFMACFHEDCNYDEIDFSATDLDNIHNLGTYNFHGYSISVSGSSADVDCTATVTLATDTDLHTDFTMKKSGDNWYILVWEEEGQGSPVFWKKRFK